MTRRASPGLLATIAGASIAAAVVGWAIYPAVAFDPAAAVVFIAAVASFAGVGAFLAIRVPGNRVGWLLLAAGVLFAMQNLAGGYSTAGVALGRDWPLTAYAAWVAEVLFVPPIIIVAAGVPLVYPDGQLPSRRWRWLAWLLVAGTVAGIAQPALMPGPINGNPTIQNPFGVPALEPWLETFNAVSTLLALPAFVGAFAAVAVRFRRGTPVERQQIKWLLAVALVAAVAFPLAFIGGALFADPMISSVAIYVGFVALVALPLAIGVAILRYRLYEIDRLVSRTIGWAVVTGVLVIVFTALVVTLQGVLAPLTHEDTLAVAASTLVAFALFQPLRRRVQRAVDRRFDRARYDSQLMVDDFAERLRDQVDLEGLEHDLGHDRRQDAAARVARRVAPADHVGAIPMTRGVRPWLLATIAGASIAAAVVGWAIYPAAAFDPATAVVFIAAVASFAGVGAFLAIRVPGNRVGWLLLAAGVLFAMQNLAGGYSTASVAAGGDWPLTAYAAWLANVLFVPPIVIAAAGVPLVYPDGHLPSPRWRWLAWLLVACTVAAIAQPALMPGPIDGNPAIQNPFGVPALEPWLATFNAVSTLLALPAFVGAFAAVAVRFRRGTSVERQQIKWLLAVALVAAVAFPLAFIGGALFADPLVSNGGIYVGFIALIAMPLAIGVAILRYRLYEIDRIVSRTIGWAVVTGVLVVVFVGLVATLEAVLAPLTKEDTLAVAASTLIAFALFQPLRRRVQRAVDRRFDRARYDGQRTVDAFAERLRNEVDLADHSCIARGHGERGGAARRFDRLAATGDDTTMTARGSGRLAAALAAVALAMTVGATLLMIPNSAGTSLQDLGFNGVGGLLLGTIYPILGWLIASRRRENSIGWLFLVIGLSQAGTAFMSEYAIYGLITAPGAVPFADIAAWFGVWVWAPASSSCSSRSSCSRTAGSPRGDGGPCCGWPASRPPCRSSRAPSPPGATGACSSCRTRGPTP